MIQNAQPTIDQNHYANHPIAAIRFAVEKLDDHYDRQMFLEAWLHGHWELLDMEYGDEWVPFVLANPDQKAALTSDASTIEGARAEEREALEPFAAIADWYETTSREDGHVIFAFHNLNGPPLKLTLGQCRAARKAIRARTPVAAAPVDTRYQTERGEQAAIAAFKAAQSVYRSNHDHFPLRNTWDSLSESDREGWRKIASATLNVVARASATIDENAISNAIAPYFEEGHTPRDAARAVMLLLRTPVAAEADKDSFQARVHKWMLACFGETITGDKMERNHRFLEEALELVQACGCTQSEAHQLVDYTFNRPIGEPKQESGGVSVTHAALCIAQGLDVAAAGEAELARIWTKVEQIRAKQAAKPKHSPLPAPPSISSEGV